VPLIAPAMVPLVLAAAATLVLRLVLWGGERTLGQFIAEALVFGGVYLAGAAWRERPLLNELVAAMRPAASATPTSPPGPLPPA
jgi:hypothetical protein